MRFFLILLFALCFATMTAQNFSPVPIVPAPDTVTVFYRSYKLATADSERSTTAYTMPNGTRYPVFVTNTGYTVFRLAYDRQKRFYRIAITQEAAEAAN